MTEKLSPLRLNELLSGASDETECFLCDEKWPFERPGYHEIEADGVYGEMRCRKAIKIPHYSEVLRIIEGATRGDLQKVVN